jgi:hypothetical protein
MARVVAEARLYWGGDRNKLMAGRVQGVARRNGEVCRVMGVRY